MSSTSFHRDRISRLPDLAGGGRAHRGILCLLPLTTLGELKPGPYPAGFGVAERDNASQPYGGRSAASTEEGP